MGSPVAGGPSRTAFARVSEFAVSEPRQIVPRFKKGQPRRAPDVRGWPNDAGIIEAGNEDTQEIRVVRRWRGMAPVNRGSARRTEEANPVV
jgi:hypothetical protein